MGDEDVSQEEEAVESEESSSEEKDLARSDAEMAFDHFSINNDSIPSEYFEKVLEYLGHFDINNFKGIKSKLENREGMIEKEEFIFWFMNWLYGDSDEEDGDQSDSDEEDGDQSQKNKENQEETTYMTPKKSSFSC